MIKIQDSSWESLGRLGNRMFIHAFGNFLAEKNNLNWECKINDEFPEGKISTRQNAGEIKNIGMSINDSSCQFFIERKIPCGAEIYGWFQEEGLVNNEVYSEYLSSLFKINKYLEINQNKVFVHVRAGDIGADNRMLPYEYYASQLSLLDFKGGSVSSDTINHPVVEKIVKNFGLEKFDGTPEQTILFGASHSNLVLSLGSFSYWIGLLSKPEAKIANIKMNEAIEKYNTAWWHSNYDLNKARKYVNT